MPSIPEICMQPSCLFRIIVVVSMVGGAAGVSCSAIKDLPAGPDLREAVQDEALVHAQARGADSPRCDACTENLIPSSDLSRDEDRDGVPDMWVRGSSPSLIRDSAVGGRP